MHDCDDFDPVVSHTKQNVKGEGAKQAAPDIAIYAREKVRVDSYPGNASSREERNRLPRSACSPSYQDAAAISSASAWGWKRTGVVAMLRMPAP